MTTRPIGYALRVGGVTHQTFDVQCPHCHKGFVAEPIEGGRAARYLGFKCPYCRLFVPLQRATESEPSEPLGSDSDA